jgi:hypothetical protein
MRSRLGVRNMARTRDTLDRWRSLPLGQAVHTTLETDDKRDTPSGTKHLTQMTHETPETDDTRDTHSALAPRSTLGPHTWRKPT